MIICIAGQSNIAIDVCEYILRTYLDVELMAITNKNDVGINRIQKSFDKYVKCNDKIQQVQLEDVYHIENLLFLSLEFDRIIQPSLFKTHNLYNIHFSKLPSYKGMYTAALPILHGAKQTGVTLHCIDSGIDTGDIIAQEIYDLTSCDTAESVYVNNIQLGTKLVIEYLSKLISGQVKPFPQSPHDSTYFSKKSIDYKNLKINFKCTAQQLNAQIRAFNFRQYQLPIVNSSPIAYSVITSKRSIHKPGTILNETDVYIEIATIDYDVLLYKDRLDEIILYCKNNDLHSILTIDNVLEFINLRTKENGWTPLMVAAYNNSYDTVEYLIENGANVNAVNYNGTTPLMYAKDSALQYGDIRILNLLLENKADRYIKDFDGKDIFFYLQNQSKELYDYIKNY